MNRQHQNNASEHAQAQAWELLLAARRIVDASATQGSLSLHYNTSTGDVDVLPGVQQAADLHYIDNRQWVYRSSLSSVASAVLDLYLPVLGSHSKPAVVVGHLGQSVDARIATKTGDAFFVTGEENRAHLHRMRALCHAVLVGAETVVIDNPQLTTRAVKGPDPVRVVLDPRGRVSSDNSLLQSQQSSTWLIHNTTVDVSRFNDPEHVQRISMSGNEPRLNLSDVLKTLKRKGVCRVFVEGGGVTVSGMLNTHCLDRVQIAVAPVLVGEGRAALQLPAALSMQSAIRPPFKLYRMGEDVLWDFDLSGSPADDEILQTENSLERLL